MKQLDEMERMARGVVDAADADIRFADETGNAHHVFNNEMLARALLAVIPVVRAAIELHESDYIDATMGGGIRVEDRDLYAKLAAVYDAIDEMRRRLGVE